MIQGVSACSGQDRLMTFTLGLSKDDKRRSDRYSLAIGADKSSEDRFARMPFTPRLIPLSGPKA